MIPRSDYMSGKVTHQEYYGQFVTREVKKLVLRDIGREAIIESTDEHFNDIRLQHWDGIVNWLPFVIPNALKEAGDCLTLCTGVCILKEAARQIKEETKSK